MAAEGEHTLHVVDVVLFGVTLMFSLGIGIYYAFSGDKRHTTSEYLVADRKLTFFPVGLSLLMSFESSIMMLGSPAECYVHGIQYVIMFLGVSSGTILCVFFLVPLFHPLKLTSAFEYLELRFKSKAVRLMGTIFQMITTLWLLGIVIYGPAIALKVVTGFHEYASICMIAIAAAVYTAIGGIKAVVWTDAFQAFIVMTGLFAVLIKGTIDSGGVRQIWTRAGHSGRLTAFDFSPDPMTRHTVWNLYFNGIFIGFAHAFDQATVQRIASVETKIDAKRMMLMASPLYTILPALAMCEGIVAYGYYDYIGCDPLASGGITNPNQIIPHFVVDLFHSFPGLTGLFLAAVFSASLRGQQK